MSDPAIETLRAAAEPVLRTSERIVLAVSGGIDSMVLLDVASALVDGGRLTVATFDHGTGPSATDAANCVVEQAVQRGLDCVRGRAEASLTSEAALRRVRWSFLRSVANDRRAVVCTGHTEDDQLETVLMRVMRDAGSRGLAGLYASSDVLRPLLGVRRTAVEAYAAARGLRWIEDPSNATPAFHRNRVRRDLLPALRRVAPTLDSHLLAVARSAAEWRTDVARFCDALDGVRYLARGAGVSVPVATFAGSAGETACLVWPELAGRVGAVLDRRGITRLTQFTVNSRVGARVQLSGGWEVVRSRNSFQLHRVEADEATSKPMSLSDGMRFGGWTFRSPASAVLTTTRDSWSAWLPTHAPLVVRLWQAGDSMVGRNGSRRKVKHLLSKAGITGHERAGWPVVLSGNEIVWVPGVRRIDATAARSGRPGLAFVCEYDNR